MLAVFGGALALVAGLQSAPHAAPTPPATAQPAAIAAKALDGPIVASAWCAVQKDGGPGCDLGAGVSLLHFHRLNLVAVIGSKTVGAGLAWVAYRPSSATGFQHTLAVAIGLVAPYDSKAGVSRAIYPALGATLAFHSGVDP